MPLFDRYIAVDWSAANTPRQGRDSIWIGDSVAESINPPTRHDAMAILTDRLVAARAANQRVMVGFDFVFGYPEGAAEAITGRTDWRALWAHLAANVTDNPDNSSNRFHVAAAINARLAAPHYWGHPHQHRYDNLNPRRPATYATVPERRRAEILARTAQPVWKLTGAGAVGSQSMLGIARLESLRNHPSLGHDIAIWPFETAFADALNKPITVVEIYPSLFPLDDPSIAPKDRGQVETCVRRFAALDAAGELRNFLSAPASLSPAEREILVREEGWIAGIGHASLSAKAAA
jgi:precorrin-8X/cobalt-precorrin-8 methylmutase